MRMLSGAILVLAAGVAFAGGAIAMGLGHEGEAGGLISIIGGAIVGLTGLGIVVREARAGWHEGQGPGGDRPPGT